MNDPTRTSTTPSDPTTQELDEQAFAQHVMLDIETVGLMPGAQILAIGAVQFGRFGLGDEFYRAVDPRKLQGKFDPETVMWWMRQSDEARAVWNDPSAVKISQALSDFEFWFKRPEKNFRYIWAHGASFDIPHLEYQYKIGGLETPWRYNHVRDTRTLYDLASVSPDRSAGVRHHALVDARAQAQAAIRALNKIGWPDGDE